MRSMEQGGVGFTPTGGAFCEAAAWVRELDEQGKLNTPQARMWAQQLTELAYRATMLAQSMGCPVGLPEELPEHSRLFPEGTNNDGTVKFSSKSARV